MPSESAFLIVGLGNIGKKYKNTRHNIGFQCLDFIHAEWKIENWHEEKKFDAYIARTEWSEKKLILAKPVTYMNLSGEAVKKISKFFKLSPEQIIIIYDDLDLPFGNIRIRKNGGPGTHNGMKSIIENLKTENFPRIRLGIETREEKTEATSYVLGTWLKKEEKVLKKIFENAKNALETALKEGFEKTMENYNE